MRKVFRRMWPTGSGSMSACRVSKPASHTHYKIAYSWFLSDQMCSLLNFPTSLLASLTSRWTGSGRAAASGPQTVKEQTGLRWAHGYEAALWLPGALPGHR